VPHDAPAPRRLPDCDAYVAANIAQIEERIQCDKLPLEERRRAREERSRLGNRPIDTTGMSDDEIRQTNEACKQALDAALVHPAWTCPR
jgi:hypothetical protein